MDKLKEVRPIVFFTCLIIGIALFLIYSFASTLIIIDSDSVDKISQLSKSVKNHAIKTTEGERDVLLAGETGSELTVTSRGDEYRLSDKNIVSQLGVQRAASAEAESAAQTAPVPVAQPAAPAQPAVKPAAAPVKAAAKPAPAPAKASVKAAAKPVAAKTTAAPAQPVSGYAYDLDLLARLITAEAQGEPYEAQVAVGAVVMNRVKSSDWPNTIKGVIYQEIGGYYQFTPVVNGWIDKPAEPECIKAAKAAMSGADPTNGAQFYYDDKVTNEWILAKPVSTQYGHMIFAF